MLTKADDYPIHQLPEPISNAGTDRNFYDRYFFNGYTRTGDVFFAAALGVYPHVNIMDASFCVVYKGVQHNIHASRYLVNMERMDTQVGPISVEVVEPLKSLRIRVEDNEQGIKADILYRGRTEPLKEPRFTRRNGPRTLMDLTRLTQNGTYEGWIEVGGERIEVKLNHSSARATVHGVCVPSVQQMRSRRCRPFRSSSTGSGHRSTLRIASRCSM